MKSDKVAATLAVLALLLIVSNLFVYSLQNRVNAQSNSGIGASSLPANYANATALLQYEWPQSTGDSSFTRFSAGPAPEAPDVLWKTDIAGIQSYISAFNGKVFVTTKSSVYALDRETGRVLWSNAVPAPGPINNKP